MKKYYLMAPGPTPVPSNVLLAMAQPMIHHRTPEYEALFIEVRAGLKRLFQTSQDVIPFTSSGTGAMEAAVVNTLSSGDTVLVLRAGKFGQRWEEICATYGITVIPLEANSELPSKLIESKVDVVFNIAEGLSGRNREAQVPALCELLGIPYTGSDSATLAIALDKALGKKVLMQHDILTPKFQLMESARERLSADMNPCRADAPNDGGTRINGSRKTAHPAHSG